MNKFVVAGIVASGLMVASCSNEAPSCASKEVQDTVIKIYREGMEKVAGAAVVASIKLELDAIRTTSTDEKTGAHMCAAQMKVTGPGPGGNIDVTYKVENTEKSGEFYVTVFDL